MPTWHTPETNDFGLVLPPTEDYLGYLSLVQPPKHKPSSVERHHLYWPKSLYWSTELGFQFREHRFNSLWLLRSDHTRIHQRYEGVFMPEDDVMEAYLDEAYLLDELGVCVKAVEMMNAAIYEGRVRQPSATEEHRQQRLETIRHTIKRAGQLEIVPGYVAELTVSRAAMLVEGVAA